jgi:hypothetical protein
MPQARATCLKTTNAPHHDSIMTKRDTRSACVLHPEPASGTLKFWRQAALLLSRLAKSNN